MSEDAPRIGWLELMRPEWLPALVVLLGGVLLYSMNVLMISTVLPSIVEEVGGARLMSWPLTGYLASSLVSATCTGLLSAALGTGRTFFTGTMIFFVGTLVCATAPSMEVVIVGRVVQGLGCGLLNAMAYVLVRQVFPQPVWPKAFAALAAVWGISVLVGPLIGGVFATFDTWRNAFSAVAILSLALSVLALKALPYDKEMAKAAPPPVPAGRVVLLCLAIAAMSAAAVGPGLAQKTGLVALAMAALLLMLRADRRAEAPLLPRDAFSLRTATGLGLWLALLVSFAFSPLSVFGPMFLQRLHGFDPLLAGYTVALASLAWTLAAVAVAGFSEDWPHRMIVIGPLIMGLGLLGMAVLMPTGPLLPLCATIAMIGLGIGSCWAFIAQRVMQHAEQDEEAIAASSVPTIQQLGFALGAAVAGLVANAVGLSSSLVVADIARAAFWVPMLFVAVACMAAAMGLRLHAIASRGAAH